jgi:hypothetical protein
VSPDGAGLGFLALCEGGVQLGYARHHVARGQTQGVAQAGANGLSGRLELALGARRPGEFLTGGGRLGPGTARLGLPEITLLTQGFDDHPGGSKFVADPGSRGCERPGLVLGAAARFELGL